MNFSQGTPFFKSHKKGINQFSKKGINSMIESKKFLHTKLKKDIILKKNNSTKSDFLLKKMSGFKQGSRGLSLNKETSNFGNKVTKKTKLNNEYGDDNDYGFQKKTKLDKFLKSKKSGKITGFKSGSMKQYKKAFTAKSKFKGGMKNNPKSKPCGKKGFPGLQIQTSFDEENNSKNELLVTNDNISFANNVTSNDEKSSPDLNIYSRAKKYY
jgi:hypothetical protein